MEMDEKESMSMVIRAVETDSIDRVEYIVGRLIDLFNSDESSEFLENKIRQARDGLRDVETAMESSLYEGMRAMRQLVTDKHIHLWSGDSVISRFQFSSQSLHYLLTRASVVLKNDSLSDKEKVKGIWDGIIESVTQDEDREKARRNLEEYLCDWRRACKHDEQRLENQIRMDFERGLEHQHSDVEDLFSQLREYIKVGLLTSKLQEAQVADRTTDAKRKGWITGQGVYLKTAEQKGIAIGKVPAAPEKTAKSTEGTIIGFFFVVMSVVKIECVSVVGLLAGLTREIKCAVVICVVVGLFSVLLAIDASIAVLVAVVFATAVFIARKGIAQQKIKSAVISAGIHESKIRFVITFEAKRTMMN